MMKIIYFGTPPFASEVLAYLLENQVEVLAIVTKPDRPRGRSGKSLFSAVKQFAREEVPDIPIFQPDRASTAAFIKELRLIGADLFVVVAYGEIISQELLDLPKFGCINLHASLLPKYRGAAPIQFALLDGEIESGVTIIEMALKMDAGDILAKEKLSIPKAMNFQDLEGELCTLGSRLLLEVIDQYEKGVVTRTPQDHREATYVQKIDSAMAQINWKQSATAVHDQIRAFSPRPGAWCFAHVGGHQRRVKIYRSVAEEGVGSPGETLSFESDGWRVACQEGALSILELQLEGKKRLTIEEFYRGSHSPPKIKI
ncbi:MAG: Methionyl-tRNA formyltransferase [Chlamydiae bacterium]|nr:Methionyl-tRNA formyltransferase [Chlamydiota bacterium]